MIRRGFSILVAAALGVGLLATPSHTAHADPPVYISNIGVSVNGGVVTFYLCVLPGTLGSPIGGAVTIDPTSNPSQVIRASVSFSGQGCGSGAYQVQATFTGLASGTYNFGSASVVLQGSGIVPGLTPQSAFAPNASGDNVLKDCPTIFNFDTTVNQAAQGCSGPGVVGNINGGATPPTSTPVPPTATPVPPTATPTNTSIIIIVPPTPTPPPANTPPPPTNTPVPPAPTATNTPGSGGTGNPTSTPTTHTGSQSPTNTPVTNSGGGGGGGQSPTNTPVPPSGGNNGGGGGGNNGGGGGGNNGGGGTGGNTSAPTATPVPSGHPTPPPKKSGHGTPHPAPTLRVSLRGTLVKPGTTQHADVTYIENALVHASIAYPGTAAGSLVGATDAHGRLTLNIAVPRNVRLHNGRATAKMTVHAVSGPWRQVSSLAAQVKPGATAHLTISGPANSPVRAYVSLPGKPTMTLYVMTGQRGHATLSVAIPKKIALSHGRATARVTVWTVGNTHHADAVRTLAISNMLVGVTPGSISSCRQRQTIHVSYLANVPVRVLLLFPHNKRLTLNARTNRRGDAYVSAAVTYAKVASPLRITVQALDARPRVHRMEQTALSVALPRACQQAATASITVGG